MLEQFYYDSSAYLLSWIVGLLVLGICAQMDLRKRWISNYVWVVSGPFALAATQYRPMTLDLIFLPLFILALGFLWYFCYVGMGDVKALVWTSVMVGVLPAIVCFAVAEVWLYRKYRPGSTVPSRGIPFIAYYYACFSGLALGVWLWIIAFA